MQPARPNRLAVVAVALALAACAPDQGRTQIAGADMPAAAAKVDDPCLSPQEDADKPIRACRYAGYKTPATGQFKVKNGYKADPKDYPALFYFMGRKGLCTASAVADQTIVTAAHCIRDGGTLETTLSITSDVPVFAVCRHAPKSDASPHMDLALCRADKHFVGPFERLNRDEALLKTKDGSPRKVLIVGFGCGEDNEASTDKPIFRDGTTTIATIEGGGFSTNGGAALCLGDSGGPTFVKLGGGKRVQIAVNSEAGLSDVSWLSSTSSADAQAFVDSWLKGDGKDQRICGFHPYAPNCG